MYDHDIDLTPQRRSFRQGHDVYSVVLELAWWQAFDEVCPNQDTRKGWLLEWLEDATTKGCNRQALIRYRIHQLVLDAQPEPGPDPDQELRKRISAMRKNRVSWRQIALRLNDETMDRDSWTEEDVKAFYYMDRKA